MPATTFCTILKRCPAPGLHGPGRVGVPPSAGRSRETPPDESLADVVVANDNERPWGRGLTMAGIAALGVGGPGIVHAANLGKMASKNNDALAGLFTPTESTVGDYKLRVQPADMDLSPRLDHLRPGLRIKGDFLRSELSKSEKVEGWNVTRGLRGNLHADFNTYGNHDAHLDFEAFRRWEGKLDVFNAKGVDALFEVSGGAYHDFLRHSPALGVSMRQELKGGSFTIANQPLSWHVEGHQYYRYNLRNAAANDNPSPWHYDVLVGVRRDYPTTIFGKSAVVSAIVGPQLDGDQNQPMRISPKLKMRVQF